MVGVTLPKPIHSSLLPIPEKGVPSLLHFDVDRHLQVIVIYINNTLSEEFMPGDPSIYLIYLHLTPKSQKKLHSDFYTSPRNNENKYIPTPYRTQFELISVSLTPVSTV